MFAIKKVAELEWVRVFIYNTPHHSPDMTYTDVIPLSFNYILSSVLSLEISTGLFADSDLWDLRRLIPLLLVHAPRRLWVIENSRVKYVILLGSYIVYFPQNVRISIGQKALQATPNVENFCNTNDIIMLLFQHL